MLSKLIQFVKTNQSEVVLGIAVVLITVISFNLGKISALNSQKKPIQIVGGESARQEQAADVTNGSVLKTMPQDQTVVASKNSKSKLYHFTWCPGASQIADKNKIVFPNEAAAIAAGYTLAGNCKK
jgi:hypothetical protein